MQNAIEIKNLCKSYKDVKAVDGISFEIKKGKSYAFLGCNGAGKSTTINMIAGILEKDSGEIIVQGENIDSSQNDFKQHLGLVFQNSALDKKLTVRENLINKAMLYGLTKQESLNNILYLSKELNFENYLDRPIEKLSGGQARRIDLARALVHNPQILILDEPTTGLDPQTRTIVWRFVNKLKKDSKLTIVLTTHYMEEASDMDDVIIIDKGRIVVQGSPSELKNKYAKDYVRLYNLKDRVQAVAYLNAEGFEITEYEDYLQFSTKNIENIRTLILKNPELFADFEVLKGKMDDVFLTVTGKNLEDNNGEN